MVLSATLRNHNGPLLYCIYMLTCWGSVGESTVVGIVNPSNPAGSGGTSVCVSSSDRFDVTKA